MSLQSSLLPQVKQLGSEQESEYSKEDQHDDEEVDWIYFDENDQKKDDADDDKSIGLEMTDDEETDDEFVHGNEQVNNNEDEEMTYYEVEESRKGDAKISDVAKADVEKIEKIKDDAKKVELPSKSSSLSVSSGFDDQFIKLPSDTSLVSIVKDTTVAKINSLLDIKIQFEVPHIQSPFVLAVPISVIYEPSVLTPILKTPSVAPATTLLTPLSVSIIPPVPHQTTAPILTPPITTNALTITTAVLESNALTNVQLRVSKLEKDVSEMNKIDHSAEALATLKSQVPTVVEHYLGSKIDDNLQKKSTLYQTMHENKSFNKNHANHALYHALIEALIADENAMDKGVADTVKNHKRQHDDDDDDEKDPSIRPNQGKKTKIRGTKESESSNKSTIKETSKVNSAGKDVVRNNDQPQDTLKPKTYKTSNQDCVKKLHGYGNLEEIMVKRADRELYKFKEGDFMDLHLNGTEDMLLLAIQHKLFHLNDSEIFDFIVALCMFTRSLIIKRHVEDLQLEVESYQKKLNITAP
nr:hypothetical protein [Tanacetum cinerariifolium]GEX18150.1 hypothetical protein [Tanacetum cinerariifolium]